MSESDLSTTISNSNQPSSSSSTSYISAPDVLCVFGNDPSSYYSTEFHISLKPKQTINLLSGVFSSNSEENYHVTITCNGTTCHHILVMLNPSTYAIEFVESNGDRTTSPSSEILKSLCLLKGKNTLTFENKYYHLHGICDVYLWSIHDKIVVIDIDGTLTRSDIRGYVETVYLGRYDYIHDGTVTFFHLLEKEYHVCVLYLTSRPRHHYNDTKAFLHLVNDQKGLHLPYGPLFTNKENVLKAIYRELVAKTSAQFKGSVLVDILSLFVLAGADTSPFCLGVGNKETDALAYRMASINASRILLVQPNSTILVSVSIPHDSRPSLVVSERESASEGLSGAHVDSQRLGIFSFHSSDKEPTEKLSETEVNDATTKRTELRFQNYADPTLWQYVRLKMMRNRVPHTPQQLHSSHQETLNPTEADDVLGTAPSVLKLGRAKSENSYSVDPSSNQPPQSLPPPPPVNFHSSTLHQQPRKSTTTIPAGTVKKKLKDMTDFFNPVESADI